AGPEQSCRRDTSLPPCFPSDPCRALLWCPVGLWPHSTAPPEPHQRSLYSSASPSPPLADGKMTVARRLSIACTQPLSDTAAIWKFVWSDTRRYSVAKYSAARRNFESLPRARR